jgi:polar amino acid transport system substrate-binding protein
MFLNSNTQYKTQMDREDLMNAVLKIAIIAVTCLCMALSPVAARDMSDIIASGKLRIGVASENAIPWIGKNNFGNLAGFEVEIARSLAEGLGVTAELVPFKYSDLVAAVLAKEVDIVISGLAITPLRARRVLFSIPYGQSDLNMLINRKKVPAAAAQSGYDTKDVTIAVIKGSASELEARDRFDAATIVEFNDHNEAREAFLAGQTNALIISKPYPKFIVGRDPDNYEIVGGKLTGTVEAMAVHPENFRLLNFANSWIQYALADGYIEGEVAYWFETLDWLDEFFSAEKSKEIKDKIQDKNPEKDAKEKKDN